jgi:hypothetical protein
VKHGPTHFVFAFAVDKAWLLRWEYCSHHIKGHYVCEYRLEQNFVIKGVTSSHRRRTVRFDHGVEVLVAAPPPRFLPILRPELIIVLRSFQVQSFEAKVAREAPKQ